MIKVATHAAAPREGSMECVPPQRAVPGRPDRYMNLVGSGSVGGGRRRVNRGLTLYVAVLTGLYHMHTEVLLLATVMQRYVRR